MHPQEVSKLIAEAPLNLQQKLSWHLRGNMEPPAPEAFIPLAVQAVLLDSYGFDWDATALTLPTGSRFEGKDQATLRDIIEGHHLELFLLETQDNAPRREASEKKEGDTYVI
jgi:hypothetical protein